MKVRKRTTKWYEDSERIIIRKERVLAEYLGFWKAGMQDHGRELQGSGGGMLAHGCVNSLLFDPVVPEASSLPKFLFSTTVSNHIFYPSEMLLFHKINLTSNDSLPLESS